MSNELSSLEIRSLLGQKVCVATAFFESGHRKIRLGEDISFFTSLDEIDFGEDGYIWSYYDETLVYEMIDKANSLLGSVYEGHPPPDTKIEVYQFFEDLFALDI